MDLTAQSMMAEQGTKPRCSQGLATLSAFERDEQGGRVGQRTFQAQIMSQDFEDLRGQRQEAFLVSFAVDAHLSVGELQVLQVQGQDLTRAQAVEEHQPDQCEIAVGAEALPELGDFFGGERHDDPPLLFEAKSPSDGGARPAVAEGGSSGVATLEMHLAGGNLLTGMEAIAAAHRTQAMIHGLRAGFGILLELVTNIVHEGGLSDLGKRLMLRFKPAGKIEQVIRVNA